MEWNPEDFGGMDRITLDQTEIWTPNVRASSAGYWALDRDVHLKVASDGTVNWWPWGIFKADCDIDLRDFPFDRQVCDMYVGAWEYSRSEVNVTHTKEDPEIVYGPYERNPEWSLQSTTISHINFTGPYDVKDAVRITFAVKRHDSAYWYKISLSQWSASILSLASFLTPLGSITRYFFASLATLHHSFLLFSLALQLGPYSSHVPYIGKC